MLKIKNVRLQDNPNSEETNYTNVYFDKEGNI